MATAQQHLLQIGPCQFDARAEHVGPGMWHSLHVLAEVIDTMPSEAQAGAREVFVQNAIRGIGLHMPCLHCRKHAVDHMTRVDPVKALLVAPPRMFGFSKPVAPALSCLEWSYRFHTVVSKRLGRKLEEIPSLADLKTFLTSLREGHGCSDCAPIAKAPEAPSGSVPMQAPPTVVALRRQLVD